MARNAIHGMSLVLYVWSHRIRFAPVLQGCYATLPWPPSNGINWFPRHSGGKATGDWFIAWEGRGPGDCFRLGKILCVLDQFVNGFVPLFSWWARHAVISGKEGGACSVQSKLSDTYQRSLTTTFVTTKNPVSDQAFHQVLLRMIVQKRTSLFRCAITKAAIVTGCWITLNWTRLSVLKDLQLILSFCVMKAKPSTSFVLACICSEFHARTDSPAQKIDRCKQIQW